MESKDQVLFFEGKLQGSQVRVIERRIRDLDGVFQDQEAYQNMDPETVAYEVFSYMPVKEGTEGGLFFGLSRVFPGSVGNEYFMTKGHFHSRINRGEFYWCTEGQGILLLMDMEGNTRAEEMFPGSLHYVPGHTAHRMVNTGNEPLTAGACWPSDAGHDYEKIARTGFSRKVMKINGKATLV
jgi:glucose-6-phosphate isomerase, archaeal